MKVGEKIDFQKWVDYLILGSIACQRKKNTPPHERSELRKQKHSLVV